MVKKTNWQLTLEYADRHKWQMRILLTSVCLSIVKSDVLVILEYIIKFLLK